MKGPGLFTMFSSVQSLSRVWLFTTPWTAAHQASLSITNSQSLPKLLSIESVMPSNHLILCRLLLLLPSIIPSIRVFSNESALRIRWPKYWSFSFNISLTITYCNDGHTVCPWYIYQSESVSLLDFLRNKTLSLLNWIFLRWWLCCLRYLVEDLY